MMEEVKEEGLNKDKGSEEDSTDNESDLEMSIEELARRPAKRARNTAAEVEEVPPQPTEINLDDQRMDVDSGHEGGDGGTQEPSSPREDNRRYGLRKRNSQMSYRGMAVPSDDEDIDDVDLKRNRRSKGKSDVLDLSMLLTKSRYSEKLLSKFMKQPSLMEKLGKWNLSCAAVIKTEKFDGDYFQTIKKFLEKNARHMDHLVLVLKGTSKNLWDMILDIISCICRRAIFMKSLSILYSKEHSDEEQQLLRILERVKGSGQKSLKSLRIISAGRGGFINTEELEAVNELFEAGIKLTDIELGDAILVTQELKAVDCLAKCLELGQDTLEKLVIHGGFKGSSEVDYQSSMAKLKIRFPKKMSALRELSICPRYTFESNSYEDKNPASKRWREVKLDSDNEKTTISPLKMTLILDHTNFSQLEKIVLGSMIELEECSFGLLRKLKTFRCGSRWDLNFRFPKTESRRGPGLMKELQFPDGLKHPEFVTDLAKFFPSVQKVWIYLPSVAVLRTFFGSYRNSSFLEELYLITMFDFETTMESCLLSDQSKKGKLSETSKDVIKTLKEYKHFEEYVRYHNIELPLECRDDQDQLPNNGAGIRVLKCLQALHIEHIPRQLLIPNPEDERKWYDHNCKYLTTKFGFDVYPFSKEGDAEIRAMNLREYRHNHILSSASAYERCCDDIGLSESDNDFDGADHDSIGGDDVDAVDGDDVDTVDGDYVDAVDSDNFVAFHDDFDDDFDDLFGLKLNTQATGIRIKPFMLLPDHFKKDKTESN